MGIQKTSATALALVLCLFASMLALSTAQAQEARSSEAGLSPCGWMKTSKDTKETLADKKKKLTADLKRKQKELTQLDASLPDAEALRKSLKRQISNISGELAEIAFKQECFEGAPEPAAAEREAEVDVDKDRLRAPAPAPSQEAQKRTTGRPLSRGVGPQDDLAPGASEGGGGASISRGTLKAAGDKKDMVEIPVFYATTRKRTGQSDPLNFYGAERNSSIEYGKLAVSIPASHVAGELELPSLWKLEWSTDRAKHFSITSMATFTAAEAASELKVAVSKASSKALFLFVHGYNTTFGEAALRTAQLANDLKFPGTAMFFSWPSAGSPRSYAYDKESAEAARKPLDELLDTITKLPAGEIFILAHSMGNKTVTEALLLRMAAKKDVSKIKEVLLAAPDLSAQTFKEEIAPALAKMTKTRKTIYASSNDAALRASAHINGSNRVGDTSEGIVTYPGFDTIDASNASTIRREWGHSYVFDSGAVIKDVVSVLLARKPIKERLLHQEGVSPNFYWRLLQ